MDDCMDRCRVANKVLVDLENDTVFDMSINNSFPIFIMLKGDLQIHYSLSKMVVCHLDCCHVLKVSHRSDIFTSPYLSKMRKNEYFLSVGYHSWPLSVT